MARQLMLFSLVMFLALAPFAKIKLTPVPAFIPAYQSALVLLDLLTAALLLGQYRTTRAQPLLVLGCGFVFTALMTIAHTLTFPGLFAPQGLLGAGTQSTAWLYMLWHAGFPLFVIAHARATPGDRSRAPATAWLGGTLLLVGLCVGLATAGEPLLPRILGEGGYTPAYRAVITGVWLSSAAAFVVLWRKRDRTLTDTWLMAVMCVWVCEVGLSAALNGGRFDLGFYAGRLYGLAAAGILLVLMLVQYAELFTQEAAVRDEELHRSEERYRQLFNSVDEGLCIVEIVFDPTGRPVDYIFREVNPAFEKQTGLTDPIGKSIRSLAPAHESFWMETYAQVLRTGQPVRFQNEARALDRWYDVYAFRLDVEQRVAVLFNDITARVRADHSLREADRRKDEFLAMLAHELRNPLAPIRAAAHVLKRGAPQPADLRKATEIILRQVVHMTGLVEELVDVSRLTRGLVTLQKTQVDLRQVLDAAVEQARPLMDARDHRLAVALPPRPAFVLGDGSRLVQLVANLLGNAARYTQPGGHVSLRLQITDGWAVISVKDNGIGMSAENVSQVFELFVQAERSPDRSEGGLGIGLALVRSVANLHGGSVQAHSDGLGRGSCFTVKLPASVEPPDEQSAEALAQPDPACNARRRVLIVDDNRDAADSLTMVLHSMGFDVVAEYDPAAALERSCTEGFDAFLLDIGLPGMTGHELARRLRQQPETASALMVAVTGYGGEQDRRLSRSAGFDHHLVKPIDADEVAKLLVHPQ
jgi:PAS domain S-box-containing protein